MLVKQAGGAEEDRPKVADFTATILHSFDVVTYIACEIVHRVGVFATFAVEMRAHALYGLNGGGMRNDHHEVDAFERSKPPGPELVVEIRASRALILRISPQ